MLMTGVVISQKTNRDRCDHLSSFPLTPLSKSFLIFVNPHLLHFSLGRSRHEHQNFSAFLCARLQGFPGAQVHFSSVSICMEIDLSLGIYWGHTGTTAAELEYPQPIMLFTPEFLLLFTSSQSIIGWNQKEWNCESVLVVIPSVILRHYAEWDCCTWRMHVILLHKHLYNSCTVQSHIMQLSDWLHMSSKREPRTIFIGL